MARVIGSGLEAHVYQEARTRALEVLGDARQQAERLVHDAEEQARRDRERALSQARRRQEDRRRQAFAQARLNARRDALRQQEELLQRLWQQAEQRLRQIAGATDRERLATLERLVRDAASQLGGGDLVLAVSSQDRPLLTPEVLEKLARDLASEGVQSLSVAPEPASIWGGVVVSRAETTQIVDNSYDARLALVQRTLRDQVGRLLSPPADPRGRGATPQNDRGNG